MRERMSTLPEPATGPEHQQAARHQCERCGCTMASDNGAYRGGHYLCSPCLRPIATVLDGIPETHRRRILGLCSGYTGSQVAEALGCGLSTPGGSVWEVARPCETSTTRLRDAVIWALEHGLIPPDKDFPLGAPEPEPAPETEEQRLWREYAEALQTVPVGLGEQVEAWLLRTIRLAYELGKLEGAKEVMTT